MYLQKQVNNWPVACEADSLHINALLTAFFLLHFEYVVVKVILQLFIGYIDTHLKRGGEVDRDGGGQREGEKEREEREGGEGREG